MKKIIVLVVLLAACVTEDPNFSPVYQVDPGLKKIVDLFYQEALNRGITLQKENLKVNFVSVKPSKYCGICTSPRRNSIGQLEININMDPECWSNEPTQNKEALVFHELAHCLLDRNHKNAKFVDGSAKSIMTSRLEGQYEPCPYDLSGNNGADCDKTNRRTYYINELFDESKDTNPFWIK